MITVDTFLYKSNFVGVTDDQITAVITEVSTTWSGALSFWATLEATIRDAKRDQLANYLVAWELADLYPTHTTGVATNGGMPLSKKEIGDVTITMLNMPVQESMRPFLTNMFGIRALQMIQSAPERFQLFGGSTQLHIPYWTPISFPT